MDRLIPPGAKWAVALAIVGSLSLGAAGVAGAAPVPSTPAASTPAASTPAASTPAAHFNCGRATKVLTRIEKVEARIAAGLPRLTAAEHRASANGHQRRADRIGKLIARLRSQRAHARLTRRSAAIEAACHVSAPAAGVPATSSAP